MKKSFLFIATILLVFVTTNCNNKKQEEKVETPQLEVADTIITLEAQNAFDDILTSYSVDTCSAIEKMTINKNLLFSSYLSLVEIPAGQTLEIWNLEDHYKGKTSETIYAFKSHGKLYLPGMRIINEEEVTSNICFDFYIETLKSNWTRNELYPFLKKYELSVRAKHSWGYTLVEDWKSFEEYYKEVDEYILDPKGSHILYFKEGNVILNQEGKCWLTRTQSKARRTK